MLCAADRPIVLGHEEVRFVGVRSKVRSYTPPAQYEFAAKVEKPVRDGLRLVEVTRIIATTK